MNKQLHTEPLHVRRKLAKAYRKEALNPRWKKAERAEFLRLALGWEQMCQNDSKE